MKNKTRNIYKSYKLCPSQSQIPLLFIAPVYLRRPNCISLNINVIRLIFEMLPKPRFCRGPTGSVVCWQCIKLKEYIYRDIRIQSLNIIRNNKYKTERINERYVNKTVSYYESFANVIKPYKNGRKHSNSISRSNSRTRRDYYGLKEKRYRPEIRLGRSGNNTIRKPKITKEMYIELEDHSDDHYYHYDRYDYCSYYFYSDYDDYL